MITYFPNSPQSPETYEQYLQYIADLDMSAKDKFELLYIVHAIMSYFVDQAFHVQTDQITLHGACKIGFDAPRDHVTIEHHPEIETADAICDSVEGASYPLEMSEP